MCRAIAFVGEMHVVANCISDVLQSPISTVSLEINNSIINRVENCKYLGVIIDDQLKWSTHIESVEQKLQRLIGILYKIRYKLPNWCLRNIYYAFVYPNILYGLEVYGKTS